MEVIKVILKKKKNIILDNGEEYIRNRYIPEGSPYKKYKYKPKKEGKFKFILAIFKPRTVELFGDGYVPINNYTIN